MYSPLQIILLGAALAAAAPIFPDITLTERSTKSFPPNPTNGTAPNNGDPPPSKECRIADFAHHMCMTQPMPFDPRECDTARAAHRKHCMGREEILDDIRKLHERYHPEDAHVPVTVPTNDTAPHNGTHRVDLHPVLKGCDKELQELRKCKAKDLHYDDCVVEQANYSQCKKHEEIMDLIRKMLEKDPPVYSNVTVFARAAANGTAPTNDDPPVNNGDLPLIPLEPCIDELAVYLRCQTWGVNGSHECVAEHANYSQCKKHEEMLDLIRNIFENDPPVYSNVTVFARAAADGTGATNDGPPDIDDPQVLPEPAVLPQPQVLPQPAVLPEPCLAELAEYEKCKTTGHGSHACAIERLIYHMCKQRATNGTAPNDPAIAIDPEGPVASVNAPTKRAAPASVPPPDSLRYKLIECNAKGYARCLSEGRGDCDAELPGPPKCDNGDLVRWLFAPGPKPEGPGATFKLVLRGPKDQRGNVLRDGEIVGNVYEAGAMVNIKGEIVLLGRIIGYAYGGPDV
ncbi:hypothetical protein SLS64_012587 [Diaporthe eres]